MQKNFAPFKICLISPLKGQPIYTEKRTFDTINCMLLLYGLSDAGSTEMIFMLLIHHAKTLWNHFE